MSDTDMVRTNVIKHKKNKRVRYADIKKARAANSSTVASKKLSTAIKVLNNKDNNSKPAIFDSPKPINIRSNEIKSNKEKPISEDLIIEELISEESVEEVLEIKELASEELTHDELSDEVIDEKEDTENSEEDIALAENDYESNEEVSFDKFISEDIGTGIINLEELDSTSYEAKVSIEIEADSIAGSESDSEADSLEDDITEIENEIDDDFIFENLNDYKIVTRNKRDVNVKVHNFLKCLYIVIFMLISLAPLIMFAISFSGKRTEENIEKKENIDFPKLYSESGINKTFDDECEEWLNQNIPFRGLILSNINVILSDVLKTPTSNVVSGSDGWIFSTETIDDYMDTNAMTTVDLRSIGITLSLIQEKAKEDGSSFLFVPVPNKNSIYPEYMPIRYQKADDNNLGRIYKELDSYNINYVNLRDKLLSLKSDTNLYYKKDTHWNVFGALAGYESIMEKLGKTPIAYDAGNYSVEYTKRGDLDKLLYPSSLRYDEEYILNNEIDCEAFEFIHPSGVVDTKAQLDNFMSDKEDHDNNFTTKKRQPEDNSSIYMVRDSFGRALLPFIIDSYNEATFVRTLTPSIENATNCDDVVYEICERNLKNVIKSAPFMYAPERENTFTKTSSNKSELNRCFYSDEGYALKIYGTIDSKMVGEDGRVFIRLYDSEQIRIYEAFPIYEEELISEKLIDDSSYNLDIDKSRSYGYSLYIDKADLSQNDYRIKVISGNNESDIVANITADSLKSSDIDGGIYNYENPYPDENANHQIVLGDGTIGIGDNINAIKRSLGNQSAPSEIVSSCLSGEDAVLYYYPNITIEADLEGFIYYISLMDNSYSDGKTKAATAKGITIGSDMAEIWNKNGKPLKENDKNCVYKTEHLAVTYSYKNGKVTSVILEDCKYKSEDDFAIDTAEEITGVEYEKGNTYLYDDSHAMQTGWQIIDGEYYFFDRLTGERIMGQVIDGIEIGENGEVNPSAYEKDKIETMMKANKIVAEQTSPSDTMEEKRRKVFDWVMSFPYHRLRSIKGIYNDEGFEILEANDIFEGGIGDCVSEAAATAFLFHEIGYNDVYFVHDTGHSWVRCEDHLFDPLFAESRSFEANYDAPFTDYRKTMDHSMLIY